MPSNDLTNHSGSGYFGIHKREPIFIIVGLTLLVFFCFTVSVSISSTSLVDSAVKSAANLNPQISSIKLPDKNSKIINRQLASSLSLRALDHTSGTAEHEWNWVANNSYASIKTYFSNVGPSIIPTRANNLRQFKILPSQILLGDDIPFSNKSIGQSPQVSGNKIVYQRPYGTEWYINESRGLEHGLTINDSEFFRSHSTLTALVSFEGIASDRKQLQDDKTVNFKLDDILVSYSQLQVIDANGRHLPSAFILPQPDKNKRLEQAGLQVAIVVDITAAQFPISIDPFINSTTSEIVGTDGVNVVLGNNVVNVGDVTGNGFDDALVTDVYGESQVGDVQSVNRGAAYLYQGSASGIGTTPIWSYSEAQLDTSGNVGANLGFWAAAAGDINQDGYNDFVVSAPQYSSPPSQTGDYIGRVYVFLGTQGGVYSQFYVNEYNTAQLTNYGKSVASADVNGDGRNDLIIGHPEYNNPQATGTQHGRVLVFHASSAGNFTLSDPATWFSATPSWSQTSTFDGALFGLSVANAGDVNNDGYDDVVIGSPGYSNGQILEGAAYIYFGSAAGVTSVNNWQIEGNQADAEMGLRVAGVGDVNGDKIDDVVISAPYWSASLSRAGKLSLYLGQATTGPGTTAAWIYYGDAKDANANVANSVGDINGDGYGDVIVGIPNYTTSTVNTTFGRVLVFPGNATGLGVDPIFDNLGSNSIGQYGYSASGGGDFNGDGYVDFLIGEPGKTATGTFSVEYVKATSDLEVTVVDSADPVAPNNDYSYTIDVINHGPDPAKGVVVIDTLPAGSVFQTVNASSNWVCNEVSLVVTCNLDTLAVNTLPDSITITTRYPNSITEIVNTVSINANVVDSNSLNNSASEPTRINASPVANNLAIATDEDVKYIASQSQDFLPGSDPDSDPLIFSLVSPGASHGTALVNSNGSFSYQPDPDYFGTDNFVYSVGDGLAQVSATVNVNVNSVNDAPIPQNIQKTIGESVTYSDTLTATDVDTPIAQLTYSVQQTPQHGNLQLNSDGHFTYTPTANYIGNDSFIFSVSDNGVPNLSNSGTVSITITSLNDPPIVSNQTFTTNEDTPFSDALSASDSQTPAAQLTFRLTGTLQTSKGALLLSPNGSFSYTPKKNVSGVDQFEFEVLDNGSPQKSSIATATINITSVNDKPDAFDADLIVLENTKATGSLIATDVDNDNLTFSIVDAPQHGSVHLTVDTGDYDYLPNAGETGVDSFTFKVFDGMVYSDPATITVDIRAAGGGNIAPSAPNLVSPIQDDVVNPSNAVFTWQPSSDPDSINLTYEIAVCLDDPTAACAPTTVMTTVAQANAAIGVPGFGMFLYVLGATRRRKNWLRLICSAVIAATLFSCSNGTQDVEPVVNTPSKLLSHKLTNLMPGSSYYWKVIVSDNDGGVTKSEVRRFITQN